MSYLSTSKLMALGAGLSDRDRAIVELVARFGVASACQIEALYFPAADRTTGARLARRTLARLTDLGLLTRLERRIGGVRRGSAGYLYRPGPYGRRLVPYWHGQGMPRGRRPHEPGRMFVRHRLAVVETYLSLIMADRAQRIELLGFDCEPACWRESMTPWGGVRLLKPDAYIRIGLGAYEDRYFAECDLGTEGRTTIRSKALAYVDYYRSGREVEDFGVFPRVLWITTTQERARIIRETCATVPDDGGNLFAVTMPDQAIDLIAAGIENTTGDELIGGAS